MENHNSLEQLKALASEEISKSLEDAYHIGYLDKQAEVKNCQKSADDTDVDTAFNDGLNLGWTLARTLFSDERVHKQYGLTPREVLFNHSAQCVWDTCKQIDVGNTSDNSSSVNNYDELLKKVTNTVAEILADYTGRSN